MIRCAISGEIENLITLEASKRGIPPTTMHRFILTEWAMEYTAERMKRPRGRPPVVKSNEVKDN